MNILFAPAPKIDPNAKRYNSRLRDTSPDIQWLTLALFLAACGGGSPNTSGKPTAADITDLNTLIQALTGPISARGSRAAITFNSDVEREASPGHLPIPENGAIAITIDPDGNGPIRVPLRIIRSTDGSLTVARPSGDRLELTVPVNNDGSYELASSELYKVLSLLRGISQSPDNPPEHNLSGVSDADLKKSLLDALGNNPAWVDAPEIFAARTITIASQTVTANDGTVINIPRTENLDIMDPDGDGQPDNSVIIYVTRGANGNWQVKVQNVGGGGGETRSNSDYIIGIIGGDFGNGQIVPITPTNNFNLFLGANIPPVVAQPIESLRGVVGEHSSFGFAKHAFYDANIDLLKYELSGLPSGYEWEPGTLSGVRVFGTPTTAGTYTVTIKASDGKASATTTFKMIIASPPQENAARQSAQADPEEMALVDMQDPEQPQFDMI